METFSYLCKTNLAWIEKQDSKVVYMEEALDLLSQLSQKARDKVMYTMGKRMYVLDNNLLKKLGDTEIMAFSHALRWHGISAAVNAI